MEAFRDYLVTDRNRLDVLARNGKGTYNVADLNRVTRAACYVASRLWRYGYGAGPECPAYLVTAAAEPPRAGSAGGGVFYPGETVELLAVPAEGYEFSRWTEDGKTVADAPLYAFQAEGDRRLAAVFRPLTTGFIPAGETEPMKTADGQEFYCKR